MADLKSFLIIYNKVSELRKILVAMLGSTQLRNVDWLNESGFQGIRDFFPSFYGGVPLYDKARWAEAGRNIKLIPELMKTAYAW